MGKRHSWGKEGAELVLVGGASTRLNETASPMHIYLKPRTTILFRNSLQYNQGRSSILQ